MLTFTKNKFIIIIIVVLMQYGNLLTEDDITECVDQITKLFQEKTEPRDIIKIMFITQWYAYYMRNGDTRTKVVEIVTEKKYKFGFQYAEYIYKHLDTDSIQTTMKYCYNDMLVASDRVKELRKAIDRNEEYYKWCLNNPRRDVIFMTLYNTGPLHTNNNYEKTIKRYQKDCQNDLRTSKFSLTVDKKQIVRVAVYQTWHAELQSRYEKEYLVYLGDYIKFSDSILRPNDFCSAICGKRDIVLEELLMNTKPIATVKSSNISTSVEAMKGNSYELKVEEPLMNSEPTATVNSSKISSLEDEIKEISTISTNEHSTVDNIKQNVDNIETIADVNPTKEEIKVANDKIADIVANKEDIKVTKETVTDVETKK